ncbi:SulP family inorganic anion transporter [Flavobacteriaceae bacterium]|jgi:MFS superfamily sulfate permease-like transporter|nr:SulP family inorganic anion transporter [Flavobacteriaceae bacterium]MDC0652485.1 SulP family inorganic anion transporter [Flavobacteriaceae bacterium]MDC1168041.1 SulP family inorganic anion transporter [Flavobacteriaceae bacterium]MDC3318670.1 SulP family inorganic anion transporter [Flavobacteriaceae bacterium]
MEKIPKTGIKGLIENWQSDVIAAVSVALIALPLSLGIALAAGAPAMSGIFSAIVGGVVTTLYRGGHISVNGPAKGVIGVILLGITLMDDGSGKAFNYVLAAVVISGAIQMLLGLMKLGRLADIFHSSVIHGILAAIGIIIFAKQIHVALGTQSDSPSIIQNLIDAVLYLPQANPFVIIISLSGLLLLLLHSKISYRFFHFLPAPMWVIALSIPFVYAFNFFDQQTLFFLEKEYQVGPHLLLDIPDTIMDSVMFPDFSKINTIEFWTTVFSILIITSIESLAIAKAVDKIDPYKRKTDLNKDLTGIGLSTMVAGAIGGLPIIAVIIRSTVNIHNGAKTKWSNMYQGILLLLFIVLLSPIMRQVPLCAFAILLVYTGFKLASPAVFKQAYNQGTEQLIFFVATMVLTLYTNLLIGLLGGLLLALVTHMLLAKVTIPQFFRMIYKSGTKLIKLPDGSFDLKISGIANFLGILKVDKLVAQIPSGVNVNIDLSETRLVGMTYMDYLVEYLKIQRATGGKVFITGLDAHVSLSTYNRALKISLNNSSTKLSQRQKRLKSLAIDKEYQYSSQIDWNTIYLKKFHYFEIRPIERKYNCLKGTFKDSNVSWEIADVTFNEGNAFTAETFNTTLMILNLNKKLPTFTMEKEGVLGNIFDRVMAFTGYKDIDFEMYPNFSKKFLLMGENESEIRSFFTDEIIHFFENHQIYHLESNGESLVIFDKIKLARTDETIAFIEYGKELASLFNKK